MPQRTIKNLLDELSVKLRRVNVDRARAEARLLISHILKLRSDDLISRDDEIISDSDQKKIQSLLERRVRFEPMAYILDKKEFLGLEFFVNRDVLIPRPETESLVLGAIDWAKSKRLMAGNILDLGTGSGCVAISLAKRLGGAFQIVAIDKSPAALAVAEKNSKQHRVTSIRWLNSDILNGSQRTDQMPEKFDMIVSNPPYIPESEISTLQRDIKNFEPRMALEAGADGLQFLRPILTDWVKRVSRPGLVALETHGPKQQEDLKSKVPVEAAKRIWHDGPHIFYEF